MMPRTQPPSRRSHTTRAVKLAASAALLLVLGLAGCGDDSDGGEGSVAMAGSPPGGGPGGGSERAIPVSAQIAEPGDLEVTLRVSTSLRARESVEVVPKQAGIISSIGVEEGRRVSEGEVLAQLDDQEWSLQAQQSEARMKAAEDAVERARALQELELISQEEVERLASEAEIARAELGLARLRVENARITSPISGMITHRYVERGQQVNTTNPAFEVADLDRLEARLAVPERESARVQVGQIARIRLEEGGSSVAEGRVERIRPVVDATSGTVQVTVAVSARSGDVPLRPGQFVNVDLVTETLSDRITLPRTAVLVDGAAPRIFLIREGQAIETEVELGFSRGDRVEIRSGLQPGDTVVVVGQDNLRPDARVRMMQLDGQPVSGGGA